MKFIVTTSFLFLVSMQFLFGQSRCAEISDVFIHTEVLPIPNPSFNEFENILNSKINLSEHDIDKSFIIYINFIINCKGETIDYKSAIPVNEDLENEIIKIFKEDLRWTPALQRDQTVDFMITIPVNVSQNRLTIEHQQKDDRRRRRR